MSFRIVYTQGYLKRAAKFIKRHPRTPPQYEKTLRLLELNPSHPSLRLHRLTGPLKDLHAVSITIKLPDHLGVFCWKTGRSYPSMSGSHEEVY